MMQEVGGRCLALNENVEEGADSETDEMER